MGKYTKKLQENKLNNLLEEVKLIKKKKLEKMAIFFIYSNNWCICFIFYFFNMGRIKK